MKISVNIEKDSLCSRFFIMDTCRNPFDSKNYSAVVKSKIVYRVEENYRHWTVW